MENERRIRECDREIVEVAYKTRRGIPLSPREREIGEAYSKGRR